MGLAACSAATPIVGFEQADIMVDEEVLSVLVADTGELRNRGLRGVEALPDDIDGMLFVFESSRAATFGMRDTLISLDLWWFSEEGRLIGSQEMEPCAADPCITYGSPAEVKWALETPVGAFDPEPGARLTVVDSS